MVKTLLFRVLISYFRCIKGMSFVISILLKEMTLLCPQYTDRPEGHLLQKFCYFNTSEGDDPPVYQYIEGSGSPMIVWKSFSDFLMDSIDIYSRSRNM